MSIPTHFSYDREDGLLTFTSSADAERDAQSRLESSITDVDGNFAPIIWGEIRGYAKPVPNQRGGLSLQFVDPSSYPARSQVVDEHGQPLSDEARAEMRRKRGAK